MYLSEYDHERQMCLCALLTFCSWLSFRARSSWNAIHFFSTMLRAGRTLQKHTWEFSKLLGSPQTTHITHHKPCRTKHPLPLHLTHISQTPLPSPHISHTSHRHPSPPLTHHRLPSPHTSHTSHRLPSPPLTHHRQT